MTSLVKTLGCIFLLGLATNCVAVTKIKVGGYHFQPFVDARTTPASGLALDLIRLFNQIQQEYRFEFVLTTAKRRYIDFEQNKYDLILFEDKKWDWQDYDIEASNAFLSDQEFYVALNSTERGQEYFDNFNDKTIAGIVGYHYKLSDYITEANKLATDYNMQLSQDHETNIKLVLNRHIDIAIINQTFLNMYLHNQPHLSTRLLISNKPDQRYEHTVLVRTGSKITVQQINAMLKKLIDQGRLEKLWKKYGIQ